MNENDNLRVLALGNPTALNSILYDINNHNIELKSLSEIDDVVSNLIGGQYHIVIVDSLYDNADTACFKLCDMATVPVALLIRQSKVNWNRLYALNVDGYIFEESGKTELLARLKAIARRKRSKQTGECLKAF